MDLTVITTYRCNSKCSMCHIWQNPSVASQEISLDVLKKIPSGIDNLNLTGGEPTLRADLVQIVDILYPKARKLEISSNGLLPERLEPIIRKYPDIKIRFSLEGFEETNNRIRGEKNGFQTKVNGLKRLKELGGQDLGFAVVMQDDNVNDLVDLYQFTREMGVELATSALHNAFQFHKSDNYPYDRLRVANKIKELIAAMLKTGSVKNWFRAYLNMGLMEKVLGHPRLITCTAATDFVFIDPWCDVFACNVRPDLKIGNIETQDWPEIYESPRADQIRAQVASCRQNCWMVGSARTAMRHPKLTSLPKWGPFRWVLENKIRATLGLPLRLKRATSAAHSRNVEAGNMRPSYLHANDIKRNIQEKDCEHYSAFGEFNNY